MGVYMLFIHMIEICANDKCIEIGRDIFEKSLAIRQEMIKRGDLRTKWWIRFIGAIFSSVNVGGSVSFTFTDTGGVSRTQYVKRNAGATLGYSEIIFNTMYCNNRFWIAVGNGTASPTIDDYRLGSKIAEALPSYRLDDVNGVIVLSASFTFSNDTTITEVGLEWECNAYSVDICARILIDRTLLSSPFTAPANTLITVTYRILV